LSKKKKSSKPVVDVLAHSLVPEMKILSDGEKRKVLDKYNISEDMLPKMSSTDPVVVALGAESGSVIRISRVEPTGKYYCYKSVL
jgi:DNA-directed RNA polymerase I, II, and III subunit RPABC1